MNKKIHNLDGFLFYTSPYTVSLGQIIKRLKHVYTLLDCRYLFKTKIDNILVHNIQLFDTCLELIVLILPVWRLYVKNLLFFVWFEFLYELSEWTLYFL